MSSAAISVGRPSSNVGIFNRVSSSLPAVVANPADALSTAEEAIFDGYDTAVENKLGVGTPSSELGMSLPRMAWRILAGVGVAAALGLAL